MDGRSDKARAPSFPSHWTQFPIGIGACSPTWYPTLLYAWPTVSWGPANRKVHPKVVQSVAYLAYGPSA